jgi:RNA polymerase sigma-70 factor (ECF subfamily)
MADDRYGLGPLLERVLRDRSRTKDPQAWDELLGRLRALSRALLACRVRDANDASDLAQEVQFQVVRKFDGFRGETVNSLLAWVHMIRERVLINYYTRRPPTCQLPPDVPEPEPDGVPFGAEDLDRLLRAVERLPEPGRTLVRGFYLEDRTCGQLASDLKRGVVWVRVNKMLAVRSLRELLGDQS